ncbi:MAG: ATPase domain-containing protein, partial [Desulfomonilaceae bacterium]|nr:ATPase domain-containing protein [Desulfomonilaceae bacterium]
LMRLIDFLKTNEITCLCTNLTHGGLPREQTDVGLSSLMDTWILLRSAESDGERNRTLFIVKSRGMGHSNQVREFRLTNKGLELVDVYVGPGGVLTGSARSSREAREKAESLTRKQEVERKQRELERKRALFQAQAAAFQAQFEAEEEELQRSINQDTALETIVTEDKKRMANIRKADSK